MSIAVQDKARRIAESGGVRPDDASGIWWVTSKTGAERRVQWLPGSERNYWTCTCEHGKFAGGRARCSHVIAVRIYSGGESA